MKYFLPILLFLLFGLNAEQIQKSTYKIDFFSIFDLSKNWFKIAIVDETGDGSELREILCLSKPDAEYKKQCKLKREKEIKIFIGEHKTDIFYDSTVCTSDTVCEFFFQARHSPRSANGKTARLDVYLKYKDNLSKLDEHDILIPDNFGENSQPVVLKLKPPGGAVGDEVSIEGKNFGKDLDKIEVYFYNLEEPGILKDFQYSVDSITNLGRNKVEDTTDTPQELEKIIAKVNLDSLNLNKNGTQELNFSVPVSEDIYNLSKSSFWRKKILMKVYVNGRASSFSTFALLPKNWNKKVVVLSVIVTLLGLAMITLILGKWNLLAYILIDPDTNTYSLSRFQAFAWTIVLAGSYFYIAICYGLILQNGEIPDFNPSLIGLLGISYTGFISSNYLSKKNPKNEISHTPPELSDLFTENGAIEISRLQLFIFTLVSITVYLYNLYMSNTLNGLPDIPVTLHGLLASSQSGYLGKKVFGEHISVTRILPNLVSVNQKEVHFSIIGAGFTKGMKVMIEGLNDDPIDVKFHSASTISAVIPMDGSTGFKSLVLIPTEGSTMTIRNPIEVLEEEEFQKKNVTSKNETEVQGGQI